MHSPFRRPVSCLLFAATLHGAAPASAAPAPPALQQVEAAAGEAQVRCYRLIHHDTFAFENCVLGMVKGERKPTARRLGIEYFGYVGAQNSARVGMLGSANTAWTFLQRFRKTQKKLHIDDLELCRTIPGDCEVRIARMHLMERSPPPPPLAGDGADDHGHVH